MAAQPYARRCRRSPDLLQGSCCSSWGLCRQRQQEPAAIQLHQVPVPLHWIISMVTHFSPPYFLMKAGLCHQRGARAHLHATSEYSDCFEWATAEDGASHHSQPTWRPRSPGPATAPSRPAAGEPSPLTNPSRPIQTDTTATQSERAQRAVATQSEQAMLPGRRCRGGSLSRPRWGGGTPSPQPAAGLSVGILHRRHSGLTREFFASAVTPTSISSLLPRLQRTSEGSRSDTAAINSESRCRDSCNRVVL